MADVGADDIIDIGEVWYLDGKGCFSHLFPVFSLFFVLILCFLLFS